NDIFTYTALLSGGITAIGKGMYIVRALGASRIADTGQLVKTGSEAAQAAVDAGHEVVPLSVGDKIKIAAKVTNPFYKLPPSERILSVPRLTKVVPRADAPVDWRVAPGGGAHPPEGVPPVEPAPVDTSVLPTDTPVVPTVVTPLSPFKADVGGIPHFSAAPVESRVTALSGIDTSLQAAVVADPTIQPLIDEAHQAIL